MLLANIIVVALLNVFHEAGASISLETCSLSCNGSEAQVFVGTGTRVQGAPGKRGAVGPKGDQGVRGHAGPRGEPGQACDCSDYDVLRGQVATLQTKVNGYDAVRAQVATLQAQVNELKEDVRYAADGWTKASNNRWYRFFDHEKVSYYTAISRCAGFGGRLVSAGVRTSSLRSEIKRLLPNPVPSTWIGLDDLTNRGTYVWSDGVRSTSSNTYWRSGQPDKSHERCALMHRSDNGQVHDIGCSDRYNYICEV